MPIGLSIVMFWSNLSKIISVGIYIDILFVLR